MQSKTTVSHPPDGNPDRPGPATTIENRQWDIARRLRAQRSESLRRKYILRPVAALTEALWRWHRRRKAYYELLSLSDSQLRDIGLRREQLAMVAAGLARAPRARAAPPAEVVSIRSSDPAAADAGDLNRAA